MEEEGEGTEHTWNNAQCPPKERQRLLKVRVCGADGCAVMCLLLRSFCVLPPRTVACRAETSAVGSREARRRCVCVRCSGTAHALAEIVHQILVSVVVVSSFRVALHAIGAIDTSKHEHEQCRCRTCAGECAGVHNSTCTCGSTEASNATCVVVRMISWILT